MHATDDTLSCASTVNETIARHPHTAAVFNAFGIDSCCGGGLTVEEAARREAVDASALCAALGEAVRAA